jgi:hypothetical protein
MDELTETERAGKEAVDCIMPGMIAMSIEPAYERLREVAAQHLAAHWAKLDDEGRLAAFTYLATVTADIAAVRVRGAVSDFVETGTYGDAFTMQGWPIRTDGGF